MEGVRRVDEWGRIRKQLFPTLKTSFRLTGSSRTCPRTRSAARRCELAERRAHPGEISLELRRSEFDTA